MEPDEIKEQYEQNREEIESRLEEFQDLREESDFRWFRELCFVIFSSRTGARDAWEASLELDRRGLLMDGPMEEIAEVIAGHEVSYEKDKASYVVENRQELSQPTLQNPTNELKLRERLDLDDPESARNWMDDTLAGVGMKAASHFLRNIGYGQGLAILSGHILDSLAELGYLESPEPPRNREEYLEKEESVKQLARDLGIEPEALDLVLWSMETGEIFR